MKKIRHAIETAAVRFGAWLVPKLPRQVTLLIARGIGTIAYYGDSRGRRTAQENLRVAFAGENITPEQTRRITHAAYQTFARTFLDLFWCPALTRENYRDFVHFQFEDPSVDEAARKNGAMWVTPHFGNFELVSYIWGFRGYSFVVVAQNFKNPALTEAFKMMRQGSGHTVVPQAGAMLRLMKTLSHGGYAALLTDLSVKPGRISTALKCFGLLTSATTLHTSVSKRLGVPVVPVTCAPLDDGTYLARVGPAMKPEDYASPELMAQAVWDWFERAIRDRPEAWMWMYKQWRYLPGPEHDPRYPDYANYYKAFARLVAESEKKTARQ